MARKLPSKPTAAKAGKKATAKTTEKKASSGANGAGISTKGDNIIARAKVIADGIAAIHAKDVEIADKREKDIKPLTDQRRKLARTLKADTGVSAQILDIELKMFAVAKRASEIKDDDHREKVFEDMAEVHRALHPGQIVNWVDVVERLSA